MEEKYSTVSQRKKMKHLKINKYTATLFSGILSLFLMATASSCQKDTFREGNSSTTSKLSSLSMDVNLGDIELDPEVAIQYAEASPARGIEMTTPKENEKVPKFDFAKTEQAEEDFPVFIALFGERQRTNCYAHATWKLIKEPNATGNGDRYFVRAKGKIDFINGFAPDTTKIKEGENWRLHAIYTPNNGTGSWDRTKQVYKWSAKKVVKKLYGAEQKLTIGTDIDIPFVLGCRTPGGNGLQWFDGYPMTAEKKFDKVTKKGYWNFGIKQLYENPEGKTLEAKGKAFNPRFKMLGSLMAIDLKNNMSREEPKQNLDTDQTILDGLTYRPTYNFQIRGFHIESTQAVTSVAYSFKDLPMDLNDAQRQNLLSVGTKGIASDAVRWIGRSGFYVSEKPQSIPTIENPTRIDIPFEKANYADLDRQSISEKLYFWMTEVDSTGQKQPNLSESYGTAIWANLYNKTLKLNVGPTFVYTAKSAHKTGTAYSSTATLLEELRLNPLARMGLDYIAGDPTQVGQTSFARKTANNGEAPGSAGPGDPGAGQGYFYSSGSGPLLKNFEKKRFKVKYIKDGSSTGDGSTLFLEESDLYWEVPDQYDLFSVFPPVQGAAAGRVTPTMTNVLIAPLADNTLYTNSNEKARIDGKLYDGLKSMYYRRNKVEPSDQRENISQNVFYAFRFIGTPMAVAVRYTELGAWYNGDGTSSTTISPHSRFIIDMKTIGNAYTFSNLSEGQAESYLRHTISKDAFWQNGNDLHPEIIRRVIHVNGYYAPNRANSNIVYGGGQGFYIWTRSRKGQTKPGGQKKDFPGIYTDKRASDKSLYWYISDPSDTGSSFSGSGKGMFVLPWLSVNQEDIPK